MVGLLYVSNGITNVFLRDLTTQWLLFLSLTMMRHERHGVSYHRHLDCMFKSLFKLPTNKTSKPQVAMGLNASVVHSLRELSLQSAAALPFSLQMEFEGSKYRVHGQNELLLVEQATFSKWCLFPRVVEHKRNHETCYCFIHLSNISSPQKTRLPGRKFCGIFLTIKI